MAELTMDAVEERLKALEHQIAELRHAETPTAPPRHNPGFTPGTGDWEAFRLAAERLRAAGTYDFDAVAKQDAIDIEHEKRFTG